MNGYKPEPFSSVGIKRLVEKPAFESSPSNFAILGRYILPANVMEYLENTQMGVGGEIQLTDALDKFLKENKLNSFFEFDSNFTDITCSHSNNSIFFIFKLGYNLIY